MALKAASKLVIVSKGNDKSLDAQIIKHSSLSKLEVMRILYYNVITPKQFALLFGVPESTVRTMMRPRGQNESVLNPVQPFYDAEPGSGPIFILKDQKFKSWVQDWVLKSQN